jgi:nucleoside-diphosphate-sugar epimerase
MVRLLAGLQAPARIVFASSRSVYGGPSTAAAGISLAAWKETDATQPTDGYGQSKLAAETLLRDSAHAGICVRLSTLFGPAPHGACPSLPNVARDRFLRGERVPLVAGDIGVDYLAVADAARVLVELALREDIADPAINLAGPARGLHGLVAAMAAGFEGAARIEFEHPPGPVWPCLDTSLLMRCLPGFEATPDEAIARAWRAARDWMPD